MAPGLEPCWPFDEYRHFVPPYGWIRDYLAYAMQCTDAPPKYHIISALAGTSIAISPEHDCVVSGEPIPIHDFFLIVGESGNRKTAAINRMLRVVRPCFVEAKLAERIWYPEACTPEGIMTSLAVDPNRLMVLSEWSDLHSQAQASYWQHTPQFWERVFDRMPITRLKMAVNLSIERPCITILGASTPSLIKRHTVQHDWDAGKLARYLICYQSKPPEMEMMNAVEHAELLPDLRHNYTRMLAPASKIAFTPSAEAKDYKDVWQYGSEWREFVRSLPEHLMPSALRAGDHVYRIASLYQASMDFPHNYVIGLDAIVPAIQFVWECLDSTRQAFALLPLHEHKPLLRVRVTLNAAGPEGMERRELLRKSHLNVREFDAVIATLRECDEIRVERALGKQFYRPTKHLTNPGE